MWLWLLVGCPKPTTPTEVSQPSLPRLTTRSPLTPVAPGSQWSGGAVSLRVPSGWAGFARDDAQHTLRLIHRDTGAEILVSTWPAGTGPRRREACSWMYQDTSLWRTVRSMSPGTVATCVSQDPLTPVVRAWFAPADVGRREVQVEVSYPPGRMFEADRAVAPVLDGLRRK